MQTTIVTTKNREVLHVEGRIDSLTAPQFEQMACAFVQKANGDILIDFSKVEYISSAGLRSLLLIAKKGREISKKIALCGLNDSIADVIRITGFLALFITYPDVASAIDA